VSRMKKDIEKAKILIESLPYIREFYNKTVVIKYGGHAMVDEELKKSFALDIILMKYIGINPVIVHGGGPQINKVLDKMQIKANYVEGMRVTDTETMDVVEMVLVGKVNKEIVGLINQQGGKAVGLSGRDGDLIRAKKMTIQKSHAAPPELIDLGRVLKAAKLILLTDVEGVLDKDSELVPSLSSQEADQLLASGAIAGGMIPKVKCCQAALAAGVTKAHIIDGRVEHAALLEIFTNQGVGTEIVL